MRTYFFMFLVLAALGACVSDNQNNPLKENQDTTATLITPVTEAVQNCYLFIAARDTYALQLVITGDSVEGKAVYRNYEKDSSHGDLKGTLLNDIFRLWYSFESEGMHSVRELYFKRSGEDLVAGIAEEQLRQDTAYVPRPELITYTGAVYHPGPCSSVPVLR